MRDAREEAALTQDAVARSLSVSQPTVSAWENGAAYPTVLNLSRFCRLTGADVAVFVEAMAEDRAVPA